MQAALRAPMFTNRWRWNATRALALLRTRAASACRSRSSACAPKTCSRRCSRRSSRAATTARGRSSPPDHPLVNETLDNCLHEAMDVDGLRRVLEAIESGAIRTLARRDAGAVADVARDPERQPLRLSRRRTARRAPRACGVAAPDRSRPRRVASAPRSGGDRRGAPPGLARRARRRRSARRAVDALRAARGRRRRMAVASRCARRRRPGERGADRSVPPVRRRGAGGVGASGDPGSRFFPGATGARRHTRTGGWRRGAAGNRSWLDERGRADDRRGARRATEAAAGASRGRARPARGGGTSAAGLFPSGIERRRSGAIALCWRASTA